MLTLDNVTLPLPEPYDSAQPAQQRENLCYVLLQILQGLKAAQSTVDIGEAIRALAYNWAELEVGDVAIRTGRDVSTVIDFE